MRLVSKIVSALVLAFGLTVAGAQTTINPTTQINWPQATGSGNPTATCSSAKYGMLYTDTTSNIEYVCMASGWSQLGSTASNYLPSNGLISSPGGYLNAAGTVTANTLSTQNLAGALLPIWGAGPPSSTGAGCITAFGATTLLVDGQRYIDTTNSIEYVCHQITISPGVFSGFFVQITGLSGTVSGSVFATTQRVQAPFQDNCGEKCNVVASGAVADAKVSKSCSMTAGSAVLTCDDAPFGAGDIGKLISVQFAGASLPGPVNGSLVTTITGYTDASHVTLAANAINTTPVGMIDPDGVSVYSTGNIDLGVGSITSTASASIQGKFGQTCLLTNFNGGLSTATATVTLSQLNAIDNGISYQVTNGGGGTGTSAPTTATISSGTATCSGTVSVSTQLASGFGYYTGAWPTTGGSGTGAVVSFYSDLSGGGYTNTNTPIPGHLIATQGTGYAVNDIITPTVSGSDGHLQFKVTKVNKTAAIWGTDSTAAFQSWMSACKGTTSCYIPSGNYIYNDYAVSGFGNYMAVTSNTTVRMEPQGAIYVVGQQIGYCTNSGYSVFNVQDNAVNVHFQGLHFEGEMQVGRTGFGCEGSIIVIGNKVANLEIAYSTFNHMTGTGVKANAVGTTGINIHDNFADQTADSAFNVNIPGLTIHHNTLIQSAIELGAYSGLNFSDNTLFTPIGQYGVQMGGSTGGTPYYSGYVSRNTIINPLRGALSIASGMAEGIICDNYILGVNGWSGTNYGIIQGGGGTLPSFGNTICNNKIETAGGGGTNNGYAALSIATANTNSAGSRQYVKVSNNTVRGPWGYGLIVGGKGGIIYGTNNRLESSATGLSKDLAIGDNVTYVSMGDQLVTGTWFYSAAPNGAIKGFSYDVKNDQLLTWSGINTQMGTANGSGPMNWMLYPSTLQSYGFNLQQIATPVGPYNVSVVGGSGSTTYTYYCTGVTPLGNETNAGATTSTSTGPATLTLTNYINVTCPNIYGASTYNVYRSVGGATQGKIGTAVNYSPILRDTGLVASGSPPATNQTGKFLWNGTNYTAGGTGAALTTGPTTSTTDDVMTAKDTTGGIKDSGISVNNLCQTNGTHCPSSAGVTLIASGSLALSTSSIAANSCQAVTAGSVNSATATGVLTTDVVSYTPNTPLSTVTGFSPAATGSGLYINAYPTAGFVNFEVCNPTTGAITPGAVTLNWRVAR